jgi:hypothetical protein
MRRRAACLVALLAVVGWRAPARAAEADAGAAPTVSGVWTATKKGGAVFRGGWSAEITAATPNVAVGSWTMTDDKGGIVMQGTWSARKEPKGWRGAWSARIAPTGSVISGTWEADDSTLKGRKSFADLLRHTAVTQIAGVWRAGRATGNWWLQSRPKAPQ